MASIFHWFLAPRLRVYYLAYSFRADGNCGV